MNTYIYKYKYKYKYINVSILCWVFLLKNVIVWSDGTIPRSVCGVDSNVCVSFMLNSKMAARTQRATASEDTTARKEVPPHSAVKDVIL